MKIISILSQKGGVGKTTLAIQLAVAAEQAKHTAVIIDLDPQASSSQWKDSRSAETPVVVSAQASRLEIVLKTAEQEGADIVIIDTAPHSESSSLAAARIADLILVPCRPSIMDLRAISNTIDLARIANKPSAVILNAVSSRGSLAKESILAIEKYGVQISPIQLGYRAAFINALTYGQAAQEYEPNSKAGNESIHLYKWTCRQVGLCNE